MSLYALKELKIELTQECPLACVHCSTNSSRRQNSSLPDEVVLRLLREAADLGVARVVFTGGEPLVSPVLMSAIGTASAFGIAPTLYTTGIIDNALTPLSCARANELAQAGLKRFIFSLYSHQANVHDTVTRYGSHAATTIAITNAISTDVPVEIHFVAMRRNYRDLGGVVGLANSWGIERVSVLRFVPQGRGRNIAKSDDLTSTELRELASLIEQFRSSHPNIKIRAGSPFNILGIGHTPCNAAQDVLVINHRGEIFPCDAFKNVRFAEPVYGSILTASLRDVWKSSEFLLRVRTTLAEQSPEPCSSCNWASTCQSGCLAQKVIRGGWATAHEPDPACLQAPEPLLEPSPQQSELVQITL